MIEGFNDDVALQHGSNQDCIGDKRKRTFRDGLSTHRKAGR